MDVLVAYDIADTESTGATRLRRVAQICEKYGQRVQHSVFECRLSPTRLARMEGELQDALDNRRDSVLIYQFAGSIEDSRHRIGRDPQHELGRPWVI